MDFPRDKLAFQKILIRRLTALYPASEAKMIAHLLLDHTKCKIEGESFSDTEYPAISQMAQRLIMAEPLQYVLGEAHFYGRDFFVNPAVLIPRSETEELVIWVRDELLGHKGNNSLKILDIGTGSGCIPVTLALELKDRGIMADLQAVDISEKALEVAKSNASRWAIPITFIQQDILNANPEDFSDLDVIVSNPPYVRESEKLLMHKNVLDFEPREALFVPDQNPLVFYKKITTLAAAWLRPGGKLFLEINESFGPEMVTLLRDNAFVRIELHRDLQGKERVVRGEKP
ncbi:MAG: peptide chain release factor N(5)-glutamine methyltransferase [Bacteroidia bacterium]|nr:peptide chain release factor N(5)-glutamine methyltransferase [Bacteroidia bacterium]